MWYWVMRLQGTILIPLFVVYCTFKHIPLHLRCRQCSRLIADYNYLRQGICEECYRVEVLSGTTYHYSESEEIYNIEDFKGKVPNKDVTSLYYKWISSRVKKRCSVIDVGCGTGYLLSTLSQENVKLFGMDLNKRAIEMAKERVPSGSFLRASATNLPFKNETFDCIICTEVLEHIPKKLAQGLVLECSRLLKTGGKCLFVVPNGSGAGGKINAEHIALYTFKEFVNLFKEAGFEITCAEKRGLYIPFISPFLEAALRLSNRRLRLSAAFDIEVPEVLAYNFCVECGKLST
jgi:2-polyprenyl-3-methyl-5-hydroxy-6-metoxy-1,4-benzoquinol methylase